VDFTNEASQRVAILQKVASTYEEKVGDQEGAFVVLQAAFRENYADSSVSGELERLATATNKWNDLLGEYTQVVQSIPDPNTAADLWVKIGRWYGEHLNHLDYAIASEQQTLTLEPNHKEALAALADFFRKKNQWPELVSTLSRHAELEEEGPSASSFSWTWLGSGKVRSATRIRRSRPIVRRSRPMLRRSMP